MPSQTELLHSLGLDEEVCGITKFCIHPAEWFRTKTRIGGTKQLNIEQITALQPDLIIANKEENQKEQVEALMQHFPVWVSDINTLEDACAMIDDVGGITGRVEEARRLCLEIQQQFNKLLPIPPIPTAYFIWRNPWMVAGGDTFTHQMMQHCGFQNVFAQTPRYPEISPDMLSETKLILLSSEPYPFKEKHIEEISKFAPRATIHLVDGEMFSWYGSRLLEAPAYFNELIQTLRHRQSII